MGNIVKGPIAETCPSQVQSYLNAISAILPQPQPPPHISNNLLGNRAISQSHSQCNYLETGFDKHGLQCRRVVCSETRYSITLHNACSKLIEEVCYIRLKVSVMIASTERPHSQFDRDTVVTQGPSVDKILLTYDDTNGIEATSVHKPPGEMFSFDNSLTTVGHQPHPWTLVHSGICQHNNREQMKNWAETYSVSLIPNPNYTFLPIAVGEGTTPDLTFVNRTASRLYNITTNPVPHNQHRPVEVQTTVVVYYKLYHSSYDSTSMMCP